MQVVLLFLMILLAGCDNTLFTKSETTTLKATCEMNNFQGFPKKVTGPVTLELKSFITILIENKDKTEKVEMTFPKSKCGVN